MTTKKILLSLLLVLTFSFSIFAQNEKTVSVDAENSSIEWFGKKVTGAHNGLVGISEGSINLKEGVIVDGSFIINMTSITVTDIENENYNAKLVKHLKSDDFFGVENHPNANLTIKSAKKTGSESSATGEKTLSTDSYTLTADLTIKGITQEITFEVTVLNFFDETMRATASIEIDRTLFDIHYGADKSLGDRMIYKNFTLNVSLSLQ